jgi:hypothetical protein
MAGCLIVVASCLTVVVGCLTVVVGCLNVMAGLEPAISSKTIWDEVVPYSHCRDGQSSPATTGG